MSGGGARAAYQVGVLRAIAKLVPRGAHSPFPILCGTSAGAINAAGLAAYAHDFRQAVRRLHHVWSRFHVEQVFRADVGGIARSGAHWLLALMAGGLGRRNPSCLLDRRPLRELLMQVLPFESIQDSIEAGVLHALSITASGYGSGESVSFFQAASNVSGWQRTRRIGVPTTIALDHLMASSAIPFVFEAVRINREYFGDGSMRQAAPISPALHLGAERILVIGVNTDPNRRAERPQSTDYPSLADIAGHVLNSIFLDTMDTDLERVQRINRTVETIPEERRRELGISLRRVETLAVIPSEDIGAIARRHVRQLPRTIRFLLRGVGAINHSSGSLVSYILFEEAYCRELIALGFHDAMQAKDAIVELLRSPAA
jgi:NTE family protein